MTRKLRIQFEGAWYHVMHRGAGRRPVFLNDSHRKYFLEILEEVIQVYGIEVHAYCLMGNHYHLIIHTPRGNLSEAMRQLNSRYTQYFNRTTKKDGALFRGRYHAIVVSVEKYLLRLNRYIHLNPIKAKIVGRLSSYKWSSYPAYLGKKSQLENLIRKETLNRFNSINFDGSYKKFVESTDDKDLEDFYKNSKFKPVLGDDDYCKKVFDFIKGQSLSAEIVGADNIIEPPALVTIVDAVADYYDVSINHIVNGIKGKGNQERKVAILLCRELGGASNNEIGKSMNNIGYTAVSKTISRAKSDPSLQKDIIKLKRRLIRTASKLSEASKR